MNLLLIKIYIDRTTFRTSFPPSFTTPKQSVLLLLQDAEISAFIFSTLGDSQTDYHTLLPLTVIYTLFLITVVTVMTVTVMTVLTVLTVVTIVTVVTARLTTTPSSPSLSYTHSS